MNLFSTSGEKLKNGTFAEKDAIARIWLLNLRIGEQKEVSYLCKTELKDLVKFGNVLNGGPEATLLEPASIVAKRLVFGNFGSFFRLPELDSSRAEEIISSTKYTL